MVVASQHHCKLPHKLTHRNRETAKVTFRDRSVTKKFHNNIFCHLFRLITLSCIAKCERHVLCIEQGGFGSGVHDAVIARFSRTLSTTFAAGVPLLEALESTAGAAGNAVYAKAIRTIKDDLTTGTSLGFSIRTTGLFPSILLQMTGICEESGSLDDMLGKVADHYETSVDNAVDSLISLMEPLIMSILGVLVGGLMIAMYLPIFMLGSDI